MKRVIAVRKVHLEEKGVKVLLGLIGALMVCYLIVLVSITFTAIEKRRSLLSAKTLHTELGAIERAYASETALLERSSLSLLGYATHERPTFASRKSHVATYTMLYAR